MFADLSDRIAGTLLFGLDVAVEFATLGEFRLVDPELALDPIVPSNTAAPLMRRPPRAAEASSVDWLLLPGPSTAVARSTQPSPQPERTRLPRAAAPLAPVPEIRCHSRRRVGSAAEPPRRPAPRKRAGSVQPGVQLCLLVE
jgi:hypothetical protein